VYGNLLLSFIRSRLASAIVYQSYFAKAWWERVYGHIRVPYFIVYNAVDLQVYTPHGVQSRPENIQRLLMVEANLAGGYELGLELGMGLAERLQALGFSVELCVAGNVSPALQAIWLKKARIPLNFLGLVKSQQIPELDRSAHLFFSADMHPACPNSVIEALACGLPVASLETGALSELVIGDAGVITPYGGNAWKLEPPDLDSLASAAAGVLREQERYRLGARQRAEEAFGLEKMVEGYLKALD
jgi:glycosyltransferase involved in cell wall biosynthesis